MNFMNKNVSIKIKYLLFTSLSIFIITSAMIISYYNQKQKPYETFMSNLVRSEISVLTNRTLSSPMEDVDDIHWYEMNESKGIALEDARLLEFHYRSLFTSTSELEKVATVLYPDMSYEFNISVPEYFLKISNTIREWFRNELQVTGKDGIEVIKLSENQIQYLKTLAASQSDLIALVKESELDNEPKYENLSINKEYWIDILEGITTILFNYQLE